MALGMVAGLLTAAPAVADVFINGTDPPCPAPPTLPTSACWVVVPSLAPDHQSIPMYVMPPTGTDLHVALVYLHGGYGQSILDSKAVQTGTLAGLESMGYWVIGVDYRGSDGHGQKFRTDDDLGGMEVGDSAAAGPWARANLPVSKVLIWGTSHGASIVDGIAYQYPTVADAYLSASGISDYAAMYPLLPSVPQRELYGYAPIGDPSTQPAKYQARSALYNVPSMVASEPLLLFAGQDDASVPPWNSTNVYDAMRAAGDQVQVQVFDGENHEFMFDSPILTGPWWDTFFAWANDAAAGDTTPPDTTISTGPAGGADTSATFGFTSTEAGGFECSLDAATWQRCGFSLSGTGSTSVSGLAVGSHTMAVRATDLVGLVDPSPATWSWNVGQPDTTPPDTTITSGPSGLTGSSTAAFTYSSSEANSTFDCKLDGASFALCPATGITYSGLADGSHTFQVRARDASNNVDPTPAIATFTVDTTPPDTTITSGPSGSVTSNSASFGFSSPDKTATFQCALDAAPFTTCTSPATYSSLALGSHDFQVRAVDPAGNIDPTPADRTWTVLASLPDTTITSGPPAYSSSSIASFSFSATIGGSTFECALDGAPFAACTSPKAYSGLAEGSHTFQVRATNSGGTDPTPAQATWTVDTVPPDTTITSGPSGSVTSNSATFSFSSSESNPTFQCSLDAAAFTGCTSPVTYSALVVGSHDFKVRAIDQAGNTDPSPADRGWSITQATPDTTLTKAPSGLVASTTANLSFTSTIAGSTFECALDAAAFTSCASPVSLTNLPQGPHTFQVRAVASGSTDPTPAQASWTVDTVAPDTTITSGPSGSVGATSATFAFTSTEAGSTFRCSLDAAAYAICSSPVTLSGLAEASHTFRVRATDPAGNSDGTPASRTWTVDLTPPETTLTKGPASSTTSTMATFEFTSSEIGSTFLCSLDGGTSVGCATPLTYSGLATGSHSFAVRAVDRAGNQDPTPAAWSWTIGGAPAGGALFVEQAQLMARLWARAYL